MHEQGGFLILLFVLVALVVVTFGIIAWRLERKRIEALAREAARLGLSFSPDRDRRLAEEYQSLRGLNDGDDRYAFDILQGSHRGHPVTAFDFHYETQSTDAKGNRSTDHHYRHIILLHLDRDFANILIGPEDVFSKIAQAFGYDDIDFESHEFSRKFCVRSPDKKLAYAFCHPGMMEFLLAHPQTRLEVNGSVIAFVRENHFDPDDLASELDFASDIRERMPAYLFAA